MKKLLLTLSVCAGIMTANAQGVYQIPNSDFENWASTDEPGNGWNSFASAGGKLSQMSSMSPAPEKVEGYNGGTAVKLKSIFAGIGFLGANANGNLTTGRVNMGNMTPSNTTNYNHTDLTSNDHCLVFAGIPDAVSCMAKFKSGGSKNGRGQFILHDKFDYKDPETSNDEGYENHKIALAAILISETSEWKYFESNFEYTGNKAPIGEQYMLASFTTNPVAGGSKNDELIIDDVKLIYYSELASLTFNGQSYYQEGKEKYDLSSLEYDVNKLTYTSNGKGATIEPKYDETTSILTLTVKGNDWSVNPSNQHIYTIQFKKPYSGEISSISYNGTPIQNFTQGTNHYYSVVGEYTEGCITATTADEGLNATVTYDATTRIATISVPKSGKDIQYFVKFARETTSYESKLIISMMGSFVGSPAQGVGISDIRDGKIDLQLSNFELTGFGLIGDIYVHDINIDTEGRITKTDNIRIFGEVGNTLGDLPLELNGQIVENELSCTLNITWSGMPIVVTVYPVSTSSIVATDIAGLDLSAVQTGLTNPNCLIYADENASNLPNVIANGVCASMNITDGYELEVPQAFSATNIALNRTFPAGWNTICLPFTTSTAMFGTDVKAQAFASADDNGLNFAEVTKLDANKPYLIYFPSETTTPVYLSADVKTTTPESVTFGDFTFCGSYEASISMAGKYGVADQGNVQKLMLGGEGSTLKATRAYFTKSGDQPAMININLDGNATGIENIEQNQADIYDVYNLQGQLIRKNATSLNGLAKGIYIVNGKKVMVK